MLRKLCLAVVGMIAVALGELSLRAGAAVYRCACALERGLDGVAALCERAIEGESLIAMAGAWWGGLFAWPAPPRGWRVRTGGVAGVICFPGTLNEEEARRLAERWRDTRCVQAPARYLDLSEGGR
ncbi:hypothetical protein [Methylosinus sp. LW4]|uniref:hypothetical protein n=1 Tax=Methylosinus sp. LW4 TaxID=136993 RepID=UPI000363B9DE|nr:hypothetical protein [Methylosinus sp. LW4]